MKGIDADGHEVTLTSEQERITRLLLTWHRHGISVTLPSVGRGSGKTVIMHTLAWMILENIEAPPPLAGVASPGSETGKGDEAL